ncbi:RNA polymerase sigma factor [Kaarinaea lacus]
MKEFKKLLIHHIPGLIRYATALVGNAKVAEDLVHDCLEYSLENHQSWDSSKNFKTWLHTQIHYVFVVQYGQNKIFPFADLNIEDLSPLKNATDMDHVSMRELINALAKLPPEQKEILLLVTLEGMDYKQIGEIMEIPVGSVMSRLHRARKHLRILMYAADESKSVALD